MASVIAMPRLGMKMVEGTVIEWRAQPGDPVKAGETVLIIETDKSEVEVEAPENGVLRCVYVEPDETVPCGTALAVTTATADEAFDPEAHRSVVEEVHATPRAAPVIRKRTALGGAKAVGAPVAPAARRLARELGLDVASIAGSGPGGRVTREDVEATADARASLVAASGGVSLEVESRGAGPTVLLWPGYGTDASVFARQVPALERFRVRAVNPRGVGFSDAPESEVYAVAASAADAAALLEQPAHIVGASLGAAVALELALVKPEAVLSLTLITPFVNSNGTLSSVIDAWRRLAAETSAETLARALVPWMFSSDFLADTSRRERAVKGFAQMAPRISPASLDRHAAGLDAWAGSRAGDLGKVAAPTLIIAAAGDRLTADAASIADAIPGARLHVVAAAGHAVALESPEAVNAALLAHLDSV